MVLRVTRSETPRQRHLNAITPPTWYRRHGELLAAMLLLVVYAAAWAYVPKGVFWHPDEGAKFLSMQALRWDGGLVYNVPYPGRVIDPAYEFYAGHCPGGDVYPAPQRDGSVRLHWPIWFPLASRPFFDAFGVAGVYVLPLLSGWLSAVIAGRWMALADSQLAPLAILLIGCGTPLFFYSLGFFEHTLSTFAGVVATSILLGSPARGWRPLLQMAPFLLVAVVLRVEMIAFATALVLTLALAEGMRKFVVPRPVAPQRWSRTSYVIAGGVVLVVLVALATLLSPRQQHELLVLPELVRGNLQKWPYVTGGTAGLLIGPTDLAPLSGAVWQSILVLSIVAAAVAPFVRSPRAEAILILGALVVLLGPTLVTAFASRPYLGRQGVLVVAPYLIVGVYVWPHAWRQRNLPLLRLACATTVYAVFGYLALFSFRVNQSGEELIGLDGCARYMLALYPLGVVLSLVAIHTIRASDRPELLKSAFSILFTAMVIASCVYELRGVREMRANKLVLVAWEGALRRQDRVVTNVWWLPAVLAPLSTTQEMYCVDDAAAVPAWLARARAYGAQSFSFCTTRLSDAERFGLGAVGRARDARQEVEGLYIDPYRIAE